MITETFTRAMKLEVTVSAYPLSCLPLQSSNTKWPTAGFSHQGNLAF